jgi:hydroxyacylglutathione hydrolase
MTTKIPATINNGIAEVSCENVLAYLSTVQLIDVRGIDEFNGELGHIEGAKLMTLGPELTRFLETTDPNQNIVFVCRSGGRSGRATAESIQKGFKSTYNLLGGMIRWNDLKLPVKRK